MLCHFPDQPRYDCGSCTETFARPSNLKRHMLTHGQKPYSCTECGKLFVDSYNLDRHCRIHTQEKPFSCPHCEKSFSQKSNLKRHIQFCIKSSTTVKDVVEEHSL